MKLRLIILLIFGLSLSSMVSPILPNIEINTDIVDSIVKTDSVKYIVFTSGQDSSLNVRRLWLDNTRRYLYSLSAIGHNNTQFLPKANDAVAIVKPKSFLETIKYADWNILSKRMNRVEANRMYQFFIHECHEWKKKSGKETILYFIDRNDFSGDSIKMYRVYCLSAGYHLNEIIDEIVY